MKKYNQFDNLEDSKSSVFIYRTSKIASEIKNKQ